MTATVARTAAEVEALRSVWNEFDREAVNADIDYHLMLVERSSKPCGRTSCSSSETETRQRSSSAASRTSVSR